MCLVKKVSLAVMVMNAEGDDVEIRMVHFWIFQLRELGERLKKTSSSLPIFVFSLFTFFYFLNLSE